MSNKPVLVVMAAGMGSRFGGLKQLTPITDQGDLIIDFSIHDAVKAGFEKVIFIIKRETEELFEIKIGKHLADKIKVEYAYQELEDLPAGFEVPDGRQKPYGTGHAVLACRDLIDSPFVVINADDYYGPSAFKLIYDYLLTAHDEKSGIEQYAMVSYSLEKTVTEHGHVARGICTVDENKMLTGIVERTRIEKHNNQIEFSEDNGTSWTELSADTQVSMNFWGFQPGMMQALQDNFLSFLQGPLRQDPLKAEYFLPGVVDLMLKRGSAQVKVLASADSWFGVTYQEDRPTVSAALTELKRAGKYPDL
jgi:dTDP-glucose pyrophosphorylase